jgi:hypothetical protein
MAAFILHQGATVQCLHAGQAQPLATDQRVKVGGQLIVTQQNQYTISGCNLPTQAGGPCVSAQWIDAATRVRASGVPVLLQDSQAICVPTGTGLKVLVTQLRVKAQ